jgi:hypothetical protein
MGLLNIWSLLTKRPIVGEQTTERLAFHPYQGLAYSGINGDAGFNAHRSLGATAPMGIVPGPSHKLNDPTVTGNNAWTVDLEALTGGNRNRQI